MMLDRWQLWMESQGLSARTIGERLSTARSLFAAAGVGDGSALTPTHIQSFLSRPMKPATRATYHASIRALCTWMQRTGERSDNPADQTPRPRRPKSYPRPISPEQLTAILDKANRQRTHDYVMLAALAGLRVHEIAKIHGRDVDPYTHVLTVTGKGGKVAQVPLHEDLEPLVRRMPVDRYWFPTYDADRAQGHVSAHAVGGAIRSAIVRAGIVATPHQLRHFYGTELVRAGVHMRVVQKLMRHESAATTAIYTEVDFSQLRDGIARLRIAA